MTDPTEEPGLVSNDHRRFYSHRLWWRSSPQDPSLSWTSPQVFVPKQTFQLPHHQTARRCLIADCEGYRGEPNPPVSSSSSFGTAWRVISLAGVYEGSKWTIGTKQVEHLTPNAWVSCICTWCSSQSSVSNIDDVPMDHCRGQSWWFPWRHSGRWRWSEFNLKKFGVRLLYKGHICLDMHYPTRSSNAWAYLRRLHHLRSKFSNNLLTVWRS